MFILDTPGSVADLHSKILEERPSSFQFFSFTCMFSVKLIIGWEIRLGNVGSATGVINLLLQHDWEKTSQTEERARSQGHIFHPYVTAAGIANQSYNKVRALAVFTHPKPSASVQNSEISVEKKNPKI